MIRLIVFLLSMFLSINSWAASKKPSHTYGVETGIDLRALKKWKKYLFLAETKNRKELLSNDYHQLMLGGYFRVNKRWRMGLFLQGEQGLRWDEDWKKDGTKWQWQNIQSRWDYSTVLDSTYANSFGKNWVWEIKNRFFYYHSREALQFRFRPGLRYFFLDEGKPWLQLYSEIETYIPVNYGEKSLYESWVYLGGLFQVTEKFSLGPVISLRSRWFHSYDSFEKRTGTDFKSEFGSTYLGLTALYTW